MRLTIRRVGNSLGVILPKSLLAAWGLGEGDTLEATERGIRPTGVRGFSHETLERHKRALALAVVRRFTPREIALRASRTCIVGSSRGHG